MDKTFWVWTALIWTLIAGYWLVQLERKKRELEISKRCNYIYWRALRRVQSESQDHGHAQQIAAGGIEAADTERKGGTQRR